MFDDNTYQGSWMDLEFQPKQQAEVKEAFLLTPEGIASIIVAGVIVVGVPLALWLTWEYFIYKSAKSVIGFAEKHPKTTAAITRAALA